MIATLAVLALCALFVRLGTWQLDRLAQRRAANALLYARLRQPPLELGAGNLALDPEEADLRRAVVRGTYDFSQEILLRNRSYNELAGVHVLVPLRLTGSDAAVLVDRGWLPYELSAPEQRPAYQDRPSGEVEVRGIVRRTQVRRGPSPIDLPLGPNRPRLDAWHRVDIPRIQEQVPYLLLPVYVEEEAAAGAPARRFPRPAPEIALSEGRHLFYAFQWFAFATILAGGYVGLYRGRT